MRRLLVLSAIVLAFTAAQAWAGEPSCGSPTVKPYGFVLFNYQFNSAIATPADIPSHAMEMETDTHELTPNHLLTARQSRIGMKINLEGPFQPMGKIEFDFRGLTGDGNAGGVLESAPRLRLAWMSFQFLENRLKLTVGQDWMAAFAPLNPVSLAHVSNPGFSGAGNLWTRVPQIRGDYTHEAGPGKVMVQLAVSRPFGADIDPHDPLGTGGQDAQQNDYLGAGEFSLLPFVDGRVSYAYDEMVTVGLSAHAGRMDFEARDDYVDRWVGGPYSSPGAHAENFLQDDESGIDAINSYAVAGDVDVNVNDLYGFLGEGYWGQNLGMFNSNIGLAYESTTNTVVQIHRAQGFGGWGQFWVKPTEITQVNAGAGVEMLDKTRLTEIGNYWRADLGNPWVGQNLNFFVNAMCFAVDGCTFAIEYKYIQTKPIIDVGTTSYEADYGDSMEDHSVNVAFQLKY